MPRLSVLCFLVLIGPTLGAVVASNGCTPATPADAGPMSRAPMELLPLFDLVAMAAQASDKQPQNDVEVIQWLANSRRGQAAPEAYALGDAIRAGREGIDEKAKDIVDNGWTVRDHAHIKVDQPIEWARGHKKDRNWSMQVHSYLMIEPLLHAHAVSGDQRYYDLSREVIRSWNMANFIEPNGKLEMRWYDMAAARRAAMQAYVLHHELRRSPIDIDFVTLLLKSQAKHLRVLTQKKYRKTTNHGLYSAMGARAALASLPPVPDKQAMLAYTRDWMVAVAKRQFTEDGIHAEDAPVYQQYILRGFRAVDEMHLFDDVPELRRVLDLAMESSYLTFHPAGEVVLIGDGASTMLTAPDEVLEFLATDGAKGRPPRANAVVLKASGVAVFRSPWTSKPFNKHTFLFFQASNHRSGHTHRDFGTFEWSLRGMPVIVNGGGYSYNKDAWRRRFKSTRAGSTVEVDGVDYAIKDKGELKAMPISGMRGGGDLGSGRWFANAVLTHERHGIEHMRTLVLQDGSWLLVVDDLRSNRDNDRTFRQYLHLHESLEPTKQGAAAKGLSLAAELTDGSSLHIVDLSKKATDVELYRGVTKAPRLGWVSRKYLEKVARTSAAFVQTGRRARFVTLLTSEGKPERTKATSDPKGGLSVLWRANGRTTKLRLDQTPDGLVPQR